MSAPRCAWLKILYAMGPRLSRLDAGREGVGEEETGRKPVLSQDGMEQGQAMVSQAVQEGCEEMSVVEGTGAVDHLYYYIFVKK